MYIDIMIKGRFYCQLKYTKRGFPEMIDGKIVEVHHTADIQNFIEAQRPSLKGKDYQIAFVEQRV